MITEEDIKRVMKLAVEDVKLEVNERLLKMNEVSEMTGLSRRSLQTMVHLKEFPKPRCVTKTIKRWLFSEVVEWMRTRPRDVYDLKAIGG